MKYRVYDNNNDMIFESNDKNMLDMFVMLNPSGNFSMFHQEKEMFMMYFENYVIFTKNVIKCYDENYQYRYE
jgi:hypothetical protein